VNSLVEQSIPVQGLLHEHAGGIEFGSQIPFPVQFNPTICVGQETIEQSAPDHSESH